MNIQRQSPLASIGGQTIKQHGWEIIRSYGVPAAEKRVVENGVGIADLSHRTKLMLEGVDVISALSGRLPISTLINGHGLEIEPDTFVYQIRFDQLYIDAPAGQEQALIDRIGEFEWITLTNVTDGRATLWVAGPDAPALLSRVCALDFADQAFPNHAAKQTSVAKTKQLILRRNVENRPGFLISGGRSLAMYLWETLFAAGRDLGVEPVGAGAYTD